MKKTLKNISVFLTGVIITMLVITGLTGVSATALASSDLTIWEKLKTLPTSFMDNLDKAFKDYTFDYNPPLCNEWTTNLNDCSDSEHTPQPEDAVSRAYFSKMLMEAFDIDIIDHSNPQFDDFNYHHTCYDYVSTMIDLGYIDTYEGEFNPDVGFNRAEAAKIITLMGDYELYSGDVQTFRDVPAEDWYFPYVSTLFIETGLDYGLFETNRIKREYEPEKLITYGWTNDILKTLEL